MKQAEWDQLPAWVRAALAQRGLMPDKLAEVEWEAEAEPRLIRAMEKPRVEVFQIEIVRE